MAAEQMSISVPPQLARFIRRKVRTGAYTDAGEVVRAAVRRMQEEEARESRASGSAIDEILADLTPVGQKRLQAGVRAGFEAIARGEYTDHIGREGLAQLAADVKTRGRKALSNRSNR